MAQPPFPIISIYRNKGLELIDGSLLPGKISARTLIEQKPGDSILYDATGRKWNWLLIAENFRNNFLTKLLAYTFYNRMYRVKITWTPVGDYTMDELRKGILECVHRDDDIITQFIDAEHLEETLRKTKTFEDVVVTLNKYVFEVNEEYWFDEPFEKE